MTLTPDQIAQIRQRAEQATKGPWCWESIAEKSNEFAVGVAFDELGNQLAGQLPEDEWIEDSVIERALIGMNESGHANFADAEFIAHARTDIPMLLAALADAEAARDLARQHNLSGANDYNSLATKLDVAESRIAALEGALREMADTNNWVSAKAPMGDMIDGWCGRQRPWEWLRAVLGSTPDQKETR